MEIDAAAVSVDDTDFRSETDGFVVVGNRAVIVAFRVVDDGAVVVVSSVFRIELDRLLAIGNRPMQRLL